MIKVNELFSGIGAFRKAFENLDIPHEIVGVSEIDKYAIKSYEAIFGETKNYGDILKIEKLDYADLWTYGFPCQDISVAGKGAGIIKGETRSGLLYEVERLLLESQKVEELPKYLIMENVKNLVGKKFRADFERWLEFLENLGYTNYWQVLNAKDYGIPQNRERVFCISILGSEEFKFPEKKLLNLRLKDILENEVDEKYYLSQEQVDRIKFSTFNTQQSRLQEKDYCDTLCARDHKDPKCVAIKNATKKSRRGRVQPQQAHTITTHNNEAVVVRQIGRYDTPTRANSSRCRVYDDNGLSPTIQTYQGGNLQPSILRAVRTEEGKKLRKAYENGDIKHGFNEHRELEPRQDGLSNTISTVLKDNLLQEVTPTLCIGSTQKNASVTDGSYSPALTSAIGTGGGHVPMIDTKAPIGTIYAHNSKQFGNGYMKDMSKTLKAEKHDTSVVYNDFRVRKLTPKECWRLMGFDDESFKKAEKVCSNSQLYKQAGNSIVVNVLEGILRNLFKTEQRRKSKMDWKDEIMNLDISEEVKRRVIEKVACDMAKQRETAHISYIKLEKENLKLRRTCRNLSELLVRC